jgi:hypothetical protein
VTEGTPRFRRISLSHSTARDVKLAAGFVYGLPEMPVEEVSLHDVSISMAPEAEPGYPEMADDMELMQRAGVYVRHVRGLRLQDVVISGQQGPALLLRDVRGNITNGHIDANGGYARNRGRSSSEGRIHS